ncbi:MAG: secretin N-terminal domain-containing protein [Planctomycetota bacterium]
MRIAGLLLLCATLALAEAPGDEKITIKVDADMELLEFLRVVEKSTARPLLFDPNGQRIRGQKMGSTFETTVPASRLFDAYRAILSFYELTLVPVGPKGYEIYLAIDSRSTNNFVKNKATFIAADRVPEYADRDGLYVATLLPIDHATNLTTIRTALSTMVTPAGIGRVMEIQGVGLIVADFAPVVATIREVVERMDQPSPSSQTLVRIEIRKHRAQDVATAIQDVFTEIPRAAANARTRRGVVSWEPTPRIVAFPSNNSIVVRATRAQVEQIRALVASLENAESFDSRLAVVPVNHAKAIELAGLLNASLRGPASPDRKIFIVADARTNSLVLSGDPLERGWVLDMLKLLDYRIPPK